MTSAFVRRAFALALAAAAIACGSSPVSPEQSGPVRLTAQINRADIAHGETAVVTFRAENLSANPVTLGFPSSCQIEPFIARRPSNEVIYPSTGGWVCAMVVTSLTLPPHGVSVRELNVIGGLGAIDLVGLAPGEYAFFARMHSAEHKLESARVSLTVR